MLLIFLGKEDADMGKEIHLKKKKIRGPGIGAVQYRPRGWEDR